MNPYKYFLLPVFCLVLGCNNASEKSSVTTSDTSGVKTGHAKTGDFLSRHPLMTWMRKDAGEIGCMLDSTLGYKDPIYHCGYKKQGKEDPDYHMPLDSAIAAKIHPLMSHIELEFEHGVLRALYVTFSDSIQKEKVRTMFNLPARGGKMPDNVMEVLYGEEITSKTKPTDTNYTRWLQIVGFEHMGAADYE
jgi:hypothetical protein